MLFASQRIGRHVSYDLFRNDATVSPLSMLFILKYHFVTYKVTLVYEIFLYEKQQSISVPYFKWSLWCAFPVVVHLVDVWNMIEAFRDNGLSTLDHNAEINVSRLETILSSIFYQLNKRLPTTHQINVDQSIGLLLNFIVATYDRCVVSEGDLFFSQGVPYGSMFL